MLLWKNADESDKFLFSLIAGLLEKHSYLIDLILDKDRPRLKDTSENIKQMAFTLSSGENLLVRLALDIWDGSGGVLWTELCHHLDERNFNLVIQTLIKLRR